MKILFLLLLSFNIYGNDMELFKKTDQFFNALNSSSMGLVEGYYAQDIIFKDPVGEIQGLDQMKAYYASMYDGVQEIRFDMTKQIETNDQLFVSWEMHIKSSKLNFGEAFVVSGSSHIKFNADGKAIYHRDYFDLGELVYERIPILSFVIKQIKKRLSQH